MQSCYVQIKNSDKVILATEDFKFFQNNKDKKLCTETPVFLDIDPKLVTISDIKDTFPGWDYISFPPNTKATIFFEEKSKKKKKKRKAEYINNSAEMKYIILNGKKIEWEVDLNKYENTKNLIGKIFVGTILSLIIIYSIVHLRKKKMSPINSESPIQNANTSLI